MEVTLYSCVELQHSRHHESLTVYLVSMRECQRGVQQSLAAEWERAQAAEDAFNEERAARYRAVLAAQQEGALDVDIEELMVGDAPPSCTHQQLIADC